MTEVKKYELRRQHNGQNTQSPIRMAILMSRPLVTRSKFYERQSIFILVYNPAPYTKLIVLFLYVIVPFWYALATYQASLVEPWFVFWRDAVGMQLVCCRSVPKKVPLGIYRTQIRPKTRRYFLSYRDQSGVLVIWRVNREKNSASEQTAANGKILLNETILIIFSREKRQKMCKNLLC